MEQRNYYILTGGPGMGKTSILTALSLLGYTCVEESGRAIIQQEMTAGGIALPWEDRSAYAQRMFQRSITDYDRMRRVAGPVFFDRGLPDTIGYLALCELPVPEDMERALRDYRYNLLVFITPPWKQIYENDRERKQSWEEAVHTYETMKELYLRLGYTVTELPQASVEERARFIVSLLFE